MTGATSSRLVILRFKLSVAYAGNGIIHTVIECISLTLNYAKRIQNLKDDVENVDVRGGPM